MPPLVTNTHCTDNVQPRGGVITSESLCVVLETVLSAAGESVQSEEKEISPEAEGQINRIVETQEKNRIKKYVFAKKI